MSVFAGDITQKGFEKKRSKLLAQYAKSPGGVAGKISLPSGGNLSLSGGFVLIWPSRLPLLVPNLYHIQFWEEYLYIYIVFLLMNVFAVPKYVLLYVVFGW